jgi:hypothetical protein
MLHRHRPHRDLGHPEWMDYVVAWLVIGLVLLLNLIMMWRIATATV